jgi:hypothetical protein
MDALYILNSKTNDVLLSKEFRENENHLKLQKFLIEFKSINPLSEKSPYIKIDETIFIYLEESGDQYTNSLDSPILYLVLLSEDNLINSIYTTLSTIRESLFQALDGNITVELIRDNFVEISLMIDTFLLGGIPTISETNVLASSVSAYNLKDKITEKFIGKAKEYDRRTLLNYLRESQTTYDSFKYANENIRSNNYEVLFHFNDILELTCDKNFNQINKILSSEIEVFSQIPNNIEMNLLLNLPFNIAEFSVDESVTTKRKEIVKKKNVDCIVRHGKYTLMHFIPALTSNLNLPFKINVGGTHSVNSFNLNVGIELEPVREAFYPLDDIFVQIFFPDGFLNSNLSINMGEFEYTVGKNKDPSIIGNFSSTYATWSIPRLEKSVSANLKGNLITENSQSVNCVLVFSCKIDKFSVSGGAVTKGTITKNPKNIDISKKARNFTFIKNLEIVF